MVLYGLQTAADFKPFVAVDLVDTCEILDENQLVKDPVPTIISGAVTHVNIHGQAVGWVKLDTDITYAFFFEPGNKDDFGEEVDVETWGLPQMTLLPLPTGTSFSEAYYIQTESTYYPYRLPSIVGIAAINESADRVAIKWSWDNVNDVWQWQLIPGIATKPSYAYAVDGSGYIAGSVKKNGDNFYTSYCYDDNNGLRYPPTNPKGVAQDIEQQFDRIAVGTFIDANNRQHAYQWDLSYNGDLTDLHPASGFDESGANAIARDYVAGWLKISYLSTFSKPALWDIQGTEYWSVYPFLGAMVSSQAYDINYDADNRVNWSGDMVISINDAAGTSGAAIWKRDITNQIDYAYELQDLVLLADYDPEGDALVHRAFSINDNGWIGGSYKPDGPTSMPLPALFIPYDTNNNDIPDYREIIVAGGPGVGIDANNNPSGRSWLLDISEDMRPGIYAAGMNGTDEFRGDPPKEGSHALKIENVQIIRNTVKSKMINNFWQGEMNQECTDLSKNINEWGLGTGGYSGIYGTGMGKEIVLTYRAVDDSLEEHEFDIVPLDPQDRENKLNGLHHMAFRFSSCIDYIQFGNEHWVGSGSLKIGDDKINEYNLLDLEDAIENDVKPWYREQAKVARVASALAGRPLRLITSGLIGEIVKEATIDNTKARIWINFLVNEFANPNELIVDLHMHYVSAGEVTTWINSMTASNHTYWQPPNHLGVLEWSPKADKDDVESWYYLNRPRHENYYKTGTNEVQWNVFVREWEAGQYYPDGFQLPYVLDTMELSGILMACYGATVQGGVFLDIYWDMAALKADAIKLKYIDDKTDRFTTLGFALDGDGYESAAQAFLVGSFVPHGSGCGCIHVCEGCVPDAGP